MVAWIAVAVAAGSVVFAESSTPSHDVVAYSNAYCANKERLRLHHHHNHLHHDRHDGQHVVSSRHDVYVRLCPSFQPNTIAAVHAALRWQQLPTSPPQ